MKLTVLNSSTYNPIPVTSVKIVAIISEKKFQVFLKTKMNDEQISLMDPSLPLADTSLAPPLPSRQVRFVPAEPPPPPPPDQEFLPSWQVDGSIENSSATFQAHYTMREYDDQLNTMKKENLNLKLRSESNHLIMNCLIIIILTGFTSWRRDWGC